MNMQPDSSDIVTTLGAGILSFVGAISKGTQWRDPKTGKISFPMLGAGLATALLLTAIVRAIGVHYGLESWAQVALAGVFGYIGPDPIIGAISTLLLRRFGLGGKNDDSSKG